MSHKTEAGIWVVLADIHFPLYHEPTFLATLDYIKRNRKKIVGFLDIGDTFDNASISPHTKGKALFQVPGSFKQESDDYRRLILEPLEKALPKTAKKVVITGNHSRWEVEMGEMHPELIGILDRYEYLRLKERGWTVVPLGMHYKIGKLIAIHGDQISGASPAKKAVEAYGSSVLLGHFHSFQSHTRVSPVDVEQKAMGFVCGTAGTVNAYFMRNKPNSWANGISLVEVRADGNFNCHLLPVVDGQFSFAGETYGEKTRKKRAA